MVVIAGCFEIFWNRAFQLLMDFFGVVEHFDRD